MACGWRTGRWGIGAKQLHGIELLGGHLDRRPAVGVAHQQEPAQHLGDRVYFYSYRRAYDAYVLYHDHKYIYD